MMRFSRLCIPVFFCTSILSACAQQPAQPKTDLPSSITPPTVQETGYLDNSEGAVGDVLGAEITRITIDHERQLQIIDLTVPIDPHQVDQVKVISKSGTVVPQDRTAQILKDYENNNVGLKLYLPKQSNWSFKLKLIDQPDPD